MLTALTHTLLVVSVSWALSWSAAAPGSGVWPLDPRPEVVAAFAPPATSYGPGHRGVDLRGRVGQPVRAAEAGTVTFAGRLAGRGVVVVSHGDTRTTYEPVEATVAVGDEVPGGATLGTLQLFGSHCFPRSCLHWGLLRGTTYLDPLSLVGAQPVRLLPLFAGPVDVPGAPVPPVPPVPLVQPVAPPWWLAG
jgi:murein DD-endopeptidase MepM/ murein hydrolase activator NlpD